VSLVSDLHRRFATLIAELTKFGLIGTFGLIIDLGGAALLHGKAGFGPLMAKAISASVASVISYTGHRLWTFRHRASQGVLRGGLIFFGLNLIGLVISLLVIGFVTGALRLQSLAAYNAAQVVGVLLGMGFRYWSYRRWVFLAFAPGQAALLPEPDGSRRTRPSAGQAHSGGTADHGLVARASIAVRKEHGEYGRPGPDQDNLPAVHRRG
jgi:putative flippase GtrA